MDENPKKVNELTLAEFDKRIAGVVVDALRYHGYMTEEGWKEQAHSGDDVTVLLARAILQLEKS